LLEKGIFEAVTGCLAAYGLHDFAVSEETVAEGGSSRVDYVVEVDGGKRLLCEAKSPSVMKSFWRAATGAGHRVRMDAKFISSAENSRQGECAIYLP
jgi:hypothetical protein